MAAIASIIRQTIQSIAKTPYFLNSEQIEIVSAQAAIIIAKSRPVIIDSPQKAQRITALI
jgi:hypothetical protein